jgi:hypothetical protein
MNSLVAVLGAPMAWMAHLLTSYAVVGLACAAGCARADGSLVTVSVACLVGALASGVLAFRRWGAAAHAEGWERDVMLVGVLGSVLFSVAIVLEAVVPVFLPLCPA